MLLLPVISKNNIVLHFGTAYETVDDILCMIGADFLIILDQQHGNEGHMITEHNAHLPFKSAQGDFLITDKKNVALGVLTADCLPIIFVDEVHGAIGIAHAGWRGSLKNIAAITFQHMQQQYGTTAADVSIFFGPCAKTCCYQVQSDFVKHFAEFPSISDVFIARNELLFFDLLQFNKELLRTAGLPQTAFNDQYNCCTICNDDYFSYRRQKDAAGRQVSVVLMR